MVTVTKKPKTDTHRVVEQDQRLSHACLWELQRHYFTRQGVEAWRQGTVPHYVTSNPFIATAYARLVFGFLRDCRAGAARLDPDQPLYLVELGAGSGRFAFHFLKKFRALGPDALLPKIPIKYVMTDLADGILDYWQAHPWLQPLVAEGWLDFARFDAGHDRVKVLMHRPYSSGR